MPLRNWRLKMFTVKWFHVLEIPGFVSTVAADDAVRCPAAAPPCAAGSLSERPRRTPPDSAASAQFELGLAAEPARPRPGHGPVRPEQRVLGHDGRRCVDTDTDDFDVRQLLHSVDDVVGSVRKRRPSAALRAGGRRARSNPPNGDVQSTAGGLSAVGHLRAVAAAEGRPGRQCVDSVRPEAAVGQSGGAVAVLLSHGVRVR